jgi:hypothetical protein
MSVLLLVQRLYKSARILRCIKAKSLKLPYAAKNRSTCEVEHVVGSICGGTCGDVSDAALV